MVSGLFPCGPSRGPCKCECGTELKFTPLSVRQNNISVPRPICGHVWNGEPYYERNIEGETFLSSVTCSKCGMTAIDHDMWLD